MTTRCVLIAIAACASTVALLSSGCAKRSEAPNASAPPPSAIRADGTIPAAKLREDLAIVKDAYSTLHPALYRYSTPAQIDAAFDAASAEFERDRTLREAFVVFSQLTAKFRCGHSFCNPANQAKDLRPILTEAGPRVPFAFRWLDGRMLITEPLAPGATGQPALSRGQEVVSINEIPVGEIFARLFTIARADGANDAKRTVNLEVDGNYAGAAFDVYLPLLFPQLADAATLTLRVRGADGTLQSVALPSQSHADRVATVKRRAGSAGENDPFWTLSRPRPDVALLEMPSWVMYKTSWNWSGFLDDTFAGLIKEKVPNLVIDLRANEGGNDVGLAILARLTQSPIRVNTRQSIIRANKVPDRLNPYLDTWDNSFRDRTRVSKSIGDGFFELSEEFDDAQTGEVKPKAPRYSGRVFVLIGPACSSATFQFASQVKATGLATLVGQPTGGNQRGITGGNFFFLRLPNSRIEMDLPLKTTPPRPGVPDAGIEPDVRVTVTQADIVAGRDVELETVYALIDGKGR